MKLKRCIWLNNNDFLSDFDITIHPSSNNILIADHPCEEICRNRRGFLFYGKLWLMKLIQNWVVDPHSNIKVYLSRQYPNYEKDLGFWSIVSNSHFFLDFAYAFFAFINIFSNSRCYLFIWFYLLWFIMQYKFCSL